MKKVMLILISFVFFPLIAQAVTTADVVSFVRCVDGDTAVFKRGEEEIKVRFLAIDTPETVHPTKEAEAFGKNASEYTCNKLVDSNEIILEYEETNKIDKYDRVLAWVWIDGSLLQKELVSVGYAKVAYIYGEYRYTNSLCLIQSVARENTLGLWLEEKDAGYCSSVDISNVSDNINYDDIENLDIKEKESLIKIEDFMSKLDKWTEKISKYADENEDGITNIYFYLMVGVAAVSIVIKSIKK